jgi:hypothetical protein
VRIWRDRRDPREDHATEFLLRPQPSAGGIGVLDDDTAELPFRIVDLDPRIVPLHPAVTPHVWRSDPMAEGAPDLLSRLGERRLEITALLGLTLGSLVLSYLGLVLGLGVVALCRFWDLPDKLLAMLALPAATLFGGIVLSWLRATRIDPVADPSERLGRALDGVVMTVLGLPLMVGWLAAAYLGYLLVRDADH